LWFDQITPHDLFDFDFQLSPVRVDLEIDGNVRAVVIGAGKQGLVVAWNADTGARLWETSVGDHDNDTLTSIEDGAEITVVPGLFGGVETPMAYAEGVLFVPVTNLGSRYTATGSTYPTQEEILAGTGELVALDAATGRRIWTNHLPSPVFAGATVACDLVLTGTFDGTVLAFERQTGAEVWRWQAPGGINGWFAVSGDTLLVPAGVSLGSSVPALVAVSLP
jgi:outer membrane protein assembly factor BamB